MKDTLIIIPAYNEEFTIGKILDNIISTGAEAFADILVINDNSNDDTEKVAAQYRAKIILINHIFNMGYGAALKTGYAYATKNKYDYIIQLDADGQHSVENIEKLHNKIRENQAADIVIGSRFIKGSISFPISLLKKIAIGFFRVLIKVFTGKKITDPTSGLQAMKRRAFSHYTGYMDFDPRYPDANMIMKMLLSGYTVEEVPSVMYERSKGESIHSGLKPIIYMLHMLLSTFIVILQFRRPKQKARRVSLD